DTILRVGVELGPVTDDQPLIRADPSRGRQHYDVELAVGRRAVAANVVADRVERALAWDRSDAVCRKDLRAQAFGRQIAHAARRDVRQQVTQGYVPGVAEPGVLNVDGEIAPLSQIHRRRARLPEDKQRRGDRHRWRDAPLARQGFIVNAVDEPSEVPLS